MTDWAWYLLLTALLLIGLFLNVFGLPGLWIMIAAALGYAWLTGFQYIGWITLGVLAGLGVLAEILEFIAGGAGARKAGGSRRAAWGALVGGLLGGFFLTLPLPIIGTIIGACAGAFLGAIVAEYTVRHESPHLMRVGIGAAKGRLWGILLKLFFGVLILAVATIKALPLRSKGSPTTLPAQSSLYSHHVLGVSHTVTAASCARCSSNLGRSSL